VHLSAPVALFQGLCSAPNSKEADTLYRALRHFGTAASDSPASISQTAATFQPTSGENWIEQTPALRNYLALPLIVRHMGQH
jgi:hypothetical protein